MQAPHSLVPWGSFESSAVEHQLLLDAFFRVADEVLQDEGGRVRPEGPGILLLDARGLVLARAGSPDRLAQMAAEGLIPGVALGPSVVDPLPHRTVTLTAGPRELKAVLALVPEGRATAAPPSRQPWETLLAAMGALLQREAQLLHQQNERREMAHHLEKLAAFYQVALATEGPYMTTGDLVRVMLQIVRLLVGADRAMLVLPESRESPTRWAVESPEQRMASLAVLKRVFEERLPVLVSHQDTKPQARELLESLGSSAALAVPVVFQDGTCPAALLVARRGAHAFTERDAELLAFVSLQVGLALENAGLRDQLQRRLDDLTTELRLAQRVQQAILPSEPLVTAGAELWGFSLPARHVGGDFYDYWDAGDGTCIGVLGDIMGKGVAAALLMALLRTQVRACAGEQPFGLPVLRHVMFATVDDFRRAGAMATLQMFRYEPVSRRLTWLVAGHHPPLLFRRGTWSLMEGPTGAALGLTRTPPGERSIGARTLEPGDLVLFWSDGLLEAACPGRKASRIEPVLRVVGDLAPNGPVDAVRQLQQRLEATPQPGAWSDDVTVLALGVRNRAGDGEGVGG